MTQNDSEPRKPLGLIDLIEFLNFVIFVLLLILGSIYILYSEFEAYKFAATGFIFLLWLLHFIVLLSLELYLRLIFKNGDKAKEIRTKVLIGCAGGLIFGWIPRIAVFLTAECFYNNPILVVLIFACLPTIFLFWSTFMFPYREKCEKTNSVCTKWIVFGVNVLLLLITIRISWLWGDYDDYKKIRWTQIGFFPICYVCMLEFIEMWKANIILTTSAATQSPVAVPVTEALNKNLLPEVVEAGQLLYKRISKEETSSSLDCKICMEEYSDYRVPRILKECGHTICEVCASNLLKSANSLKCPFCQEVTRVNGPANLLPKNYTIMDLVDEKMNRNRS